MAKRYSRQEFLDRLWAEIKRIIHRILCSDCQRKISASGGMNHLDRQGKLELLHGSLADWGGLKQFQGFNGVG